MSSASMAAIPKRVSLPKGQLLIDGKWRDASGGATTPTFDPMTEEKITDVAKASAADAEQAVLAASKAFEKALGDACIMRSAPGFCFASPICWTSGRTILLC